MPAPAIAVLGQMAAPLLPHLIRYAHEKAVPFISDVLSDPDGYASRVGDLIVWNGAKGKRVIAGLQSLGESQDRIEQAITSIESTQIATTATLATVQAVSIATLGVTSLTGALMLWRLQALNKRFDRLSQKIQDLADTVDAQNKSHLEIAAQRLRAYDDSDDDKSLLVSAKEEAQRAANIYGQLSQKEATQKKPRLEVLNYRGRCYLTGLICEMRALLLQGGHDEVAARFSEEQGRIESLAKATFENVIGRSPSPFLSADMESEGVTLRLMTEIYQNAARLGAFQDAEIKSESDMFEYCRANGIPKRSWFPPKKETTALACKLKFLMACFEDIGRAESLKLMAQTIKGAGSSFKEVQDQIKSWCEANKQERPADTVFAYSFV